MSEVFDNGADVFSSTNYSITSLDSSFINALSGGQSISVTGSGSFAGAINIVLPSSNTTYSTATPSASFDDAIYAHGWSLETIGTEAEAARATLDAQAAALNGLISSANSASTLDQYEGYKSQYESTLASYNKGVTGYNTLLDRYDKTAAAIRQKIETTKAVSYLVDVPNAKDKNQWLPGGTLKNDTYPGGSLWSPVAPPSFGNRKEVDKFASWLTGGMLGTLNAGYTSVQSLVMGGALDLMFDEDIRVTKVYKITTTVTDSGTGEVLYTSSSMLYSGGEGEGGYSDSYGNVGGGIQTNTLQGMLSLAEAWQNRSDIRGFLGMNPISIGLTIVDVLMDQEVSLQTRLTGAVLGTVYNTFNQMAMKGIAQLAGVTQMTPGVMVGMGLLGAVFGELFEMAMGLDNAFGFGGELNTKASAILGQKVFGESKGFMGLSTLGKSLAFSLGITDMVSYELVNEIGLVAGVVTTIDTNGWGFGGDVTTVQSYSDYTSFGPQSMATDAYSIDWTSIATDAFAPAQSLTSQTLSQFNATFDSGFNEYGGLTDQQANMLGMISDNFGKATADYYGRYFSGQNNGYGDFGGVNGNNAGGWGDGGSNNTDGMGNNSNDTSGVGNQSASQGGYGDGNGGFGGI